jgi:hypothetical protein
MRASERKTVTFWVVALAVALTLSVNPAIAADKPNIILIVSDDFGYGDSAPYGGGPGRGMPTPALDRWRTKE